MTSVAARCSGAVLVTARCSGAVLVQLVCSGVLLPVVYRGVVVVVCSAVVLVPVVVCWCR